MSVRLFVGNLPYSVNEDALREHFSAIGPLSYILIPVDRESGKPRGFAFVEFNERAHAEEAIRRLNNQPLMGRALAINEARPQSERSQSGPSQSGPIRGAAPPLDLTERKFGPDASPKGRRPPNRKSKPERGPKKPIRERSGGQFFGPDDDDSHDDDDSFGDNFASRVSDSED